MPSICCMRLSLHVGKIFQIKNEKCVLSYFLISLHHHYIMYNITHRPMRLGPHKNAKHVIP